MSWRDRTLEQELESNLMSGLYSCHQDLLIVT